MIRGKGRGTAVCAPVQLAVASTQQLLMAHAVTNDTGDWD